MAVVFGTSVDFNRLMGFGRVLSVEDDDSSFFLMQMAFEESVTQPTLCRAETGFSAITLLQRYAAFDKAACPGLVFLDVDLPGMDGLEVLAFMRAKPTLSDIPVVVFTSIPAEHQKQRALALGAKEYLVKPPSFQVLVKLLDQTCSRYLTPSSD